MGIILYLILVCHSFKNLRILMVLNTLKHIMIILINRKNG